VDTSFHAFAQIAYMWTLLTGLPTIWKGYLGIQTWRLSCIFYCLGAVSSWAVLGVVGLLVFIRHYRHCKLTSLVPTNFSGTEVTSRLGSEAHWSQVLCCSNAAWDLGLRAEENRGGPLGEAWRGLGAGFGFQLWNFCFWSLNVLEIDVIRIQLMEDWPLNPKLRGL
jgi:hypothetical protein